VAHEELGLVGDRLLERLADVDLEVADRVALDLATRRL
jgi:hypothetical protein